MFVALGLVAAACSVTVEGRDVTQTPPTSSNRPLDPLRLAPDGLLAVSFGRGVDEVTEDLTSRFGAPDTDSGWIAADNLYGTCPGDQTRAIGWGSLVTLFAMGDPVTAASGFFAWTYGFDLATNTGGADPRGIDLVTEDDIGLGSTRTELVVAYGTRLTETEDLVAETWSFDIDAEEALGMRGLLDGPGQAATVTSIESSPGCSP